MRLRPAVAAGLLAGLAACGAEQDDPSVGADDADLLTTAYPVTVLDDGDGAELCLGGVAESLPPQCSGPGVVGWDWTDHAGAFEDVRGTRWGDFVVTGSYDGETVTPTEVVPAADATQPEPPEDTLPAPGTGTSERELRRIQRALHDTPGFLTSGVSDQRVELGVVHDDGSLQQRLDERYGAGVVVVWSALQPVG
ncbi:hypothetical protein [Nocardioides dongkuii]|uniref:hypothetical protein n=1 Tax=Nocardioides dongkuii TaxID=2760089 RepID=UPI0015FC1138|nr:hypothetical protein [Nocardioides dongkuii]